jgi:hypothetical protein
MRLIGVGVRTTLPGSSRCSGRTAWWSYSIVGECTTHLWRSATTLANFL